MIPPRADWDARFLALAAHVATWSKDPSTRVGAVLVGRDRREIAIGYNGFPPGIDDSPARLAAREVRYVLTQHAERNVLDNARFEPRGGTLYLTLYPCAECAKSIASKGLARVVAPRLAPHAGPAGPDPRDWRPAALRWTHVILGEAGVRFDLVAPL